MVTVHLWQKVVWGLYTNPSEMGVAWAFRTSPSEWGAEKISCNPFWNGGWAEIVCNLPEMGVIEWNATPLKQRFYSGCAQAPEE